MYGPGVDEPLAEWNGSRSLKVQYLHHDALGSITLTTYNAENGAERAYRTSFKAFGQSATTNLDPNRQGWETWQTRLGYTSREKSVGGLMQYRSRWYDSGYGRMLGQDEYRGETSSPPSLHRYVYVENRPVNASDPSGETAYSSAFPHHLYRHWDIEYYSFSFSLPVAVFGQIGVGYGYLIWDAGSDDHYGATGIAMWVGLTFGRIPFGGIYSSMSGFSRDGKRRTLRSMVMRSLRKRDMPGVN